MTEIKFADNISNYLGKRLLIMPIYSDSVFEVIFEELSPSKNYVKVKYLNLDKNSSNDSKNSYSYWIKPENIRIVEVLEDKEMEKELDEYLLNSHKTYSDVLFELCPSIGFSLVLIALAFGIFIFIKGLH